MTFQITLANHLFLADLHLHITSEFDWYRYNLLKNKIKETIKQYQPTALFYLGDLLDRSPNKYDTTALLSLLYSIDLPTYILEGNHDRSKNDTYLRNIINEVNFKHVIWLEDLANFTLDGVKYEAVSNNYIRLKNKLIPKDDTILLSHIACKMYKKKAEYDFDELNKYRSVILGDIHTAFKIDPYNIYYTGSPYKTHFTSIKDLSEIDNSGFGCLVFDGFTIKKVEFNIPNKYRLQWASIAPPELATDDLVEVVYNVKLADSANLDPTDKVKILYQSNLQLQQEDFTEVILDYLRKKYGITDAAAVIKELSLLTDEV